MKIEEMNDLIHQLGEAEAAVQVCKNELNALSAKAEEIRTTIFQTLVDAKMDKFAGTNGTVSVATRYQVKMPKDYAVKAELKDYLQKHDAFDAMWSINHQTLNSWFKAEMQNAQEDGVYLDIPGLEPTSEQYLMFRRKK